MHLSCRTAGWPTTLTALSALGLSAVAAQAIGPEVIYTKIPTHSSSIVPGALDLSGQPAVTNFRALEDVFLSPDGSKWFIRGRTQQGADLETITLMGSGLSGTMFLQEGQPVPEGQPGELIDFFGSSVGRFNENNQFALSLRARGGVASVFHKVIVWDGATFNLPIQMGDFYTGLVDLPPNPSGDETVGNSIGSIHLLNDLTVGSHDPTILGIHTSRRPAITYNHAAFKQTGVSTFLSMDGQVNHTYGGMSLGTFYTTPDGTRWLVHATILGAPSTSDAVLVVDGQAVLQEGSPVGSSSAVVSTFVNTDLLTNGDWFSRGLRAVSGVWAARNGVLLAQTGDPVVTPLTGPAENWSTTFLSVTGNTKGDWVLVGKTDNANLAIDDVIVLNGTQVIVREGDPVDLDNNGVFDDNVFIGRGNNTLAAFETNDIAITDDDVLYFFANLRDGQGNDLNSNPSFGAPQAFLRIDLGFEPCLADITGNGQVNIDDLLAVINAWGNCTRPCTPGPVTCFGDIDDNCTVNIDDLLQVILAWGACP